MSISHFWSNKKCCTAEQAVQHFLLVFFFYFGKTALADIFSLEEYDIVCIAAEYAGAGWFIFSQDDPILIRAGIVLRVDVTFPTCECLATGIYRV